MSKGCTGRYEDVCEMLANKGQSKECTGGATRMTRELFVEYDVRVHIRMLREILENAGMTMRYWEIPIYIYHRE